MLPPPRDTITPPPRQPSDPNYPLAKPITPPSPVLTVSQLPQPPWSIGSIPILFESDDGDDERSFSRPATPSPHSPTNSRDSYNTFGPSASWDPSRPSSRSSLDTFASFIHSRPISVADSAFADDQRRNALSPPLDVLETPRHSRTIRGTPSPRVTAGTAGPSEYQNVADHDDGDDVSSIDFASHRSRVSSTSSLGYRPPLSSAHPYSSPGSNSNDLAPPNPPHTHPIIMRDSSSEFTISAYLGVGSSVDGRSDVGTSAASERAPLLKTSAPSQDSFVPSPSRAVEQHLSTPLGPALMIHENTELSLRHSKELSVTPPALQPHLPSHPSTSDPSSGSQPSSTLKTTRRPSVRHPTTSYQQPSTMNVPRSSYLRLGSSGDGRVDDAGTSGESLQNSPETTRDSNAIPVAQKRHRSGSTASNSSSTSLLEPSLDHLKDVVIGLYIDQEHFREINPQFVFNRYYRRGRVTGSLTLDLPPSPKPPPSPKGKSSHGTESYNSYSTSSTRAEPHFEGVAEYRPPQRQSWCFHYAPLDSPPTLRRMSVNGDSKRDYMSREASLVVKSNGVYAVKGSEDRGRTPWQFTYLVDDRRNSAGEKVPGEKMLTPLSFSCSPELLGPEHGKKIGIIRVVKKSVSLKLVAAKVNPPFPSPRAATTELAAETSAVSKRISKKASSVSRDHSAPPPMLVQATVITTTTTTSTPTTSPVTPSTRSFKVDLMPTSPASDTRHKSKLSDSSKWGVPLLSKSLSTSSLWEARRRDSKLVARPLTARDENSKSKRTSRPSRTSQRVRPATADPSPSPREESATVSRPKMSPTRAKSGVQLYVATEKPSTTVDEVRIPVTLIASAESSKKTEESKLIGGPIASKEQIRRWLSETPTPPPKSRNASSLLFPASGYSLSAVSSPPSLTLSIRSPAAGQQQHMLPAPPRSRTRSSSSRARPSTASEPRKLSPIFASSPPATAVNTGSSTEPPSKLDFAFPPLYSSIAPRL